MTMQKLCLCTQQLTHNGMPKLDYLFLYTLYSGILLEGGGGGGGGVY